MKTTFYLEPQENQVQIQFEDLRIFAQNPRKFGSYLLSNVLRASTPIVCLWLCHKTEKVLVENFDVFEFSTAQVEGWDDVTLENFQWQRFMLNLLEQDYFDAQTQKLCIRLSCTDAEMKNLVLLSTMEFNIVPKNITLSKVTPAYFSRLDDMLAEV